MKSLCRASSRDSPHRTGRRVLQAHWLVPGIRPTTLARRALKDRDRREGGRRDSRRERLRGHSRTCESEAAESKWFAPVRSLLCHFGQCDQENEKRCPHCQTALRTLTTTATMKKRSLPTSQPYAAYETCTPGFRSSPCIQSAAPPASRPTRRDMPRVRSCILSSRMEISVGTPAWDQAVRQPAPAGRTTTRPRPFQALPACAAPLAGRARTVRRSTNLSPSRATAVTSEWPSIGFVRCSWNPARSASIRSSFRAKAVSAAAGIAAIGAGCRPRSFRISP